MANPRLVNVEKRLCCLAKKVKQKVTQFEMNQSNLGTCLDGYVKQSNFGDSWRSLETFQPWVPQIALIQLKLSDIYWLTFSSDCQGLPMTTVKETGAASATASNNSSLYDDDGSEQALYAEVEAFISEMTNRWA